MWNCRRVHRSE